MYDEIKFYGELDEYLVLYDKGLKKHAKKLIAEAMLRFDTLDTDIQHRIALAVCADFLDEKKRFHQLLERGNGEMPFELSKRVKPILEYYCEQNNIHAMRWYYELYKDYEILQKAYTHTDCDRKTVNLYFNTFIHDFWWGSHHFPEGCLITHDEYDEIVAKCEEIAEKHKLSKEHADEFNYYRNLYSVWWEYSASDKSKDFDNMCKERELAFSPVITIYYE